MSLLSLIDLYEIGALQKVFSKGFFIKLLVFIKSQIKKD